MRLLSKGEQVKNLDSIASAFANLNGFYDNVALSSLLNTRDLFIQPARTVQCRAKPPTPQLGTTVGVGKQDFEPSADDTDWQDTQLEPRLEDLPVPMPPLPLNR